MGCDEEAKDPQQRGSDRQAGKKPRNKPEIIYEDIFSRAATEEQMAALRAAAEKHKAAQAALMEAAGVLWNSKVDASMAIGGPHGASLAMSQRLNFFDNCTCSPCKIIVGD
jgi:hypothetical protein